MLESYEEIFVFRQERKVMSAFCLGFFSRRGLIRRGALIKGNKVYNFLEMSLLHVQNGKHALGAQGL